MNTDAAGTEPMTTDEWLTRELAKTGPLTAAQVRRLATILS